MRKKNEKPIVKYSYGQQMRIITAFALAHHPKVLLLDESTANLDPVFCREYLDDLQTMINEEEAAAVLKKKNRFSNVICVGYYLTMLGVILVQIASFMMSKGQSAKGGWWILIFFGTMFVDTYTAAYEKNGLNSFETLLPYIPVSKKDYDRVRKQHRRRALYYIAPLAMLYFAVLIYGMIRWHRVVFRIFYVLVVIAGIVLLELFGPARPVR